MVLKMNVYNSVLLIMKSNTTCFKRDLKRDALFWSEPNKARGKNEHLKYGENRNNKVYIRNKVVVSAYSFLLLVITLLLPRPTIGYIGPSYSSLQQDTSGE